MKTLLTCFFIFAAGIFAVRHDSSDSIPALPRL